MTNFVSIAGKTSPDNNRNTPLHDESLREGGSALSGKLSPIPNSLPFRTSSAEGNTFFLRRNHEDTAIYVAVLKKKKSVVSSTDIAHPAIYGVLLVRQTTPL